VVFCWRAFVCHNHSGCKGRHWGFASPDMRKTIPKNDDMDSGRQRELI